MACLRGESNGFQDLGYEMTKGYMFHKMYCICYKYELVQRPKVGKLQIINTKKVDYLKGDCNIDNFRVRSGYQTSICNPIDVIFTFVQNKIF